MENNKKQTLKYSLGQDVQPQHHSFSLSAKSTLFLTSLKLSDYVRAVRSTQECRGGGKGENDHQLLQLKKREKREERRVCQCPSDLHGLIWQRWRIIGQHQACRRGSERGRKNQGKWRWGKVWRWNEMRQTYKERGYGVPLVSSGPLPCWCLLRSVGSLLHTIDSWRCQHLTGPKSLLPTSPASVYAHKAAACHNTHTSLWCKALCILV